MITHESYAMRKLYSRDFLREQRDARRVLAAMLILLALATALTWDMRSGSLDASADTSHPLDEQHSPETTYA